MFGFCKCVVFMDVFFRLVDVMSQYLLFRTGSKNRPTNECSQSQFGYSLYLCQHNPIQRVDMMKARIHMPGKSSDVIIDHHRCFRFLLLGCDGIISLRRCHVWGICSGLLTWIVVCYGWMSMKARFQAGSMEGFASQAALMILDLGCFFFFSGWWFQTLFATTWGNDPIWLIFFKWVETTN